MNATLEQAIWVRRNQPAGDGRAHRVTDDVCALDLQVIEQPHHVARQLLAVRLRIVRLAALAVAAQSIAMARDSGPGRRRRRWIQLRSRVPGGRAQDDRLSLSLLDVVDGHTVRVEELIWRRRCLGGGER